MFNSLFFLSLSEIYFSVVCIVVGFSHRHRSHVVCTCVPCAKFRRVFSFPLFFFICCIYSEEILFSINHTNNTQLTCRDNFSLCIVLANIKWLMNRWKNIGSTVCRCCSWVFIQCQFFSREIEFIITTIINKQVTKFDDKLPQQWHRHHIRQAFDVITVESGKFEKKPMNTHTQCRVCRRIKYV